MPYPNEHSCRLLPPGTANDRVRRSKEKMHDKEVSVIYYVKDNKAKRQAIRFPKATWTAAEARGICKREGGTFEAAAATESDPAAGLKLAEVRAKAGRQYDLDVPEATSESAPQTMQESYPLPPGAIAESDEGDMIRNCTFLRAGMNKTGQRRWPADLLRNNIRLFEGSLCYIDHPSPLSAQRSLRSLAARTLNPRWDEEHQAVIGDIKLLGNEASAFVKSTFADEVVRDSGAAGLSVLFDSGDFKVNYERVGGRTIQVPTSLGPGRPSIDFVADPTGGGSVGTF